MKEKKEKFKHPKGLHLVNIMIGIQCYAGYALSAVVVLFYTLGVDKGGLGLSKGLAGNIYSGTGVVAAILALFAGYLTDRYIGVQKAVLWGIFFNSIGTGLVAFGSGNIALFYTGLCINIVAGALYKNNITAIVGMLYTKDQVTLKDAAYSLYYMAVNIGVIIGPIIGGFVYQEWYGVKDSAGQIVSYGFKQGYLMVAVSLFLTFLIFYFLAPKWLGDVGKYPSGVTGKNEKKDLPPLTKQDKKRMVAMVIIFIFVSVFWTAYFQTGTTISLMTNELVDLKVGSFTIPITWLTSFNGFLCAVLAPVFGAYWVKRAQSKKGDFKVGTKIAAGMILTGIGFLIFIMGIRSLDGVLDGSRKMSIFWILGGFFVLTIGELLFSPVCIALFSKLAPEKYASSAMNFYFMNTAASSLIGGWILGLTGEISYEAIMWWIAGIMVFLGLVMIVIKKPLENLMEMDKLTEKVEIQEA